MADRFPQRNRHIVFLVDDGWSYGDVARHLGLTRSVVAGVVHRARHVPAWKGEADRDIQASEREHAAAIAAAQRADRKA